MNKTNNISLLAMSFGSGFRSPNIPIVTFNQGDVELNFVLDTGSDLNVIDVNVLPTIEYEETDYKGTLAGIGGVQDVKCCKITFQHEDNSFTTNFLISETLKPAFDDIRKCHAIPIHGMLGSVFLRSNNIVLDFNRLVAYNKDEKKD